jgi:hypothetical protein
MTEEDAFWLLSVIAEECTSPLPLHLSRNCPPPPHALGLQFSLISLIFFPLASPYLLVVPGYWSPLMERCLADQRTLQSLLEQELPTLNDHFRALGKNEGG